MESEADRFKLARKELALTLQDVVAMTGYSMSTLSGVENGHDKPSKRLRAILIDCLDLNEEWLVSGRGKMSANRVPPDDYSLAHSPVENQIMNDPEFINIINRLRLMPAHESRHYLKAVKYFLSELRGRDKKAIRRERRLSKIQKNSDLTHITLLSNTPTVKSEIQKLIEQVKRKASRPGAKAGLARMLDVAPARISEWLSGEKEPGGEYTLRLLKWVEQQERKK